MTLRTVGCIWLLAVALLVAASLAWRDSDSSEVDVQQATVFVGGIPVDSIDRHGHGIRGGCLWSARASGGASPTHGRRCAEPLHPPHHDHEAARHQRNLGSGRAVRRLHVHDEHRGRSGGAWPQLRHVRQPSSPPRRAQLQLREQGGTSQGRLAAMGWSAWCASAALELPAHLLNARPLQASTRNPAVG